MTHATLTRWQEKQANCFNKQAGEGMSSFSLHIIVPSDTGGPG